MINRRALWAIPLIVVAATSTSAVPSASAQDKRKFVGTWRIDPARSDRFSGNAPPETITVEGPRMTITRTRPGSATSITYMLNGTPSRNVWGPPGKPIEMSYTSVWEGHVLVTTIVGPHLTRVESRSIEADGTMRVETSWNWIKQPRGTSGRTKESWMVFVPV